MEREHPLQKIEPANFEELFTRRLERYNSDQAMVTSERQEQTDITTRLKEVNSAFASARKGDSSSKAREQALQKLETSYVRYKEIIANLEVGRTFYNDLANIVIRFRDECRNFANQRRAEARSMQK